VSIQQIEVGDQVFHPTYGFGTVERLTTRDEAGQSKDYYGVRLSEGGILSVPVTRAESLGLRRVVNGLQIIVRCLRSPAKALPDNDRERVLGLKACWQSPQPMAVAEGVRDLLARSRTHNLTPADKKWLVNACERLSGEAARVDAIELGAARTVILEEVDQLKSRQGLK
jgi:RNA polymerase-interacting CarD/CdnL/TRCF family regulator